MSELLPNLEPLASRLKQPTGAQADALALITAARDASTVEELDEAVRTVITGWRRP